MSVFEVLMLVCFAAGWPVSIYKSYVSRVNSGKSVIFLIIIAVGYAAGETHKILYNYDWVIYLYMLNGLMVCVDIGIYWKNSKLIIDH